MARLRLVTDRLQPPRGQTGFQPEANSNIIRPLLGFRMDTASESEVQLTLSLFLVGFSFGQAIYGPLSDALGRRSVILAGLALYAVTSLLCATSQSADQLVAFRFLQAAAAASGSVLGRAVIRDLYSGPRLAWAMSMLMLVLTIAPLVAPALGSLILGLFGWRAIFFLALPSGIASIVLTLVIIPKDTPQAGKGIDVLGLATMTIFLVALLLALTQGQRQGWDSGYIISLFIIAGVFFVLFLIIESGNYRIPSIF